MKKRRYSKTLWANLIIAALALIVPGLSEKMASNPEFSTVIITVVNFILRLITKEKLV